MKTALKTIAITIALSPLMAFGSDHTGHAAAADAAKAAPATAADAAKDASGTPVDVKISGMTCGSCVKKVEDALAKLNGVDKKTLKVELAGNHATLKVAKNDAKMMDAIKAAVKKAGYTVDKIDVVAGNASETKAN